MPDESDPLDRFFAEQQKAELAEWEKHIDHRHELRARRRPERTERDRDAVVGELEAGSAEIDELANAIGSKDDAP